MIKSLQIAAECFPAAKAGGLGDVVGALAVYFPREGVEASVIIPKYGMKWFDQRIFTTIFASTFHMGSETIAFEIQKLESKELSFPFYCVNIPGKFDRESIYLDTSGWGYADEIQRNISFQRAILIWLRDGNITFDLVHCHDHQSGLIPFFMKRGLNFSSLKDIPICFTIHNAGYVGAFGWYHYSLLPEYKMEDFGLLDWDGQIHSLSTGVKMADIVNTVSPHYMEEIKYNSGSLVYLWEEQKEKCIGILNGIDTELWDPKTDEHVHVQLKKSWKKFKSTNKKHLCQEFHFNSKLPLTTFIGRLTDQKGAEILAQAVRAKLKYSKDQNFIILGSGDKWIESELMKLESDFPNNFKALITYNEPLAHKLYAASDFIIMPSRFEPCGLNQMFAMRYGTIPIVRATGGLIDTVPDIEDGGLGIQFKEVEVDDVVKAIIRANDLFLDKEAFEDLISRIVVKDHSWNNAIKKYATEYKKLIHHD